MRTAFINALLKEAEENPKIFLLCGDLGYSVLEPFQKSFPDRFLNVGIAEQNMIAIACGLAKEGYSPFVYSIGNFPSLRCFEQIRYDVCYHSLPVRIVSVGAGYAYGPLGASHHATEDLGAMRVLPRLNIYCPSDPLEAQAVAQYTANKNEPTYIRLGKAGEKIIHQEVPKSIELPLKILDGQKTLVLSHGAISSICKDHIHNFNLGFALYSVPCLKPFDSPKILELFSKFNQIVCVEEHQKIGGLGSTVIEYCSDHSIFSNPGFKVHRIAAEDFISFAGSQNYIIEQSLNLSEKLKRLK